MGFGGISIWQLLIVLAIVVLLFGTKRLGSIGSDLGKAIKGFKKSVKDDDEDLETKAQDGTNTQSVEDRTDNAHAQKEKAPADEKSGQ